MSMLTTFKHSVGWEKYVISLESRVSNPGISEMRLKVRVRATLTNRKHKKCKQHAALHMV